MTVREVSKAAAKKYGASGGLANPTWLERAAQEDAAAAAAVPPPSSTPPIDAATAVGAAAGAAKAAKAAGVENPFIGNAHLAEGAAVGANI